MKTNVSDVLQRLVSARGPVGQEDEVRTVCQHELERLKLPYTIDAAGNLIVTLAGKKNGPAQGLFLHMDELSFLVKRVNDDGSLAIKELGYFFPFTIGQGPVEILGDAKTLPGVLSLGGLHTTKETEAVWRAKPEGENKSVSFADMYVFTGLSKAELQKSGVHPGTRVVVAQQQRKITSVGNYIASYFFDNRAAIAVGLRFLALFKGKQPQHDLHIIFSTAEEIGCHGAAYAAQQLNISTAIAVDVAPAEKEYAISLEGGPVLVYSDYYSVYDVQETRKITQIAKKNNIPVQTAALDWYGSDAIVTKTIGASPRAVLFGLPTANTHGYEIIHQEIIESTARLLQLYF